MSDQDYDIYLTDLTPLSVDLIEDETNTNNEFFDTEYEILSSGLIDEIPFWIDETNEISSIENLDVDNDNETLEYDKIIDNSEQTNFTPYVIIDSINGKIQ
jgi:hypothetical protein